MDSVSPAKEIEANATLDQRAADIAAAIRDCLPPNQERYALHEPVFQGNEWQYVKECIDTGWVSSVGKFVDEIERALSEFCGVERAVAVVNGTAALHAALELVGVEPGDEVLTPAITFIATANAVSYCGATPHFVDADPATMGVDARALGDWLAETAESRGSETFNKQTGRRIKALIIMHTLGHPSDIDACLELCERYKLDLIEDAAESLGSYYRGRHTGGFGRVGTLSFNGNKVVTTGGGGAILTNDPELGAAAKHLTTTAKQPHAWRFYHDRAGYNYRMPNINAALGLAQLEKLPAALERKRALAARYAERFSKHPEAVFFNEPEGTKSNYWLNAIILKEDDQELLERVLDLTNENGLQTRPLWEPMHTLPMYANCPRMELPVAESLRRRVLTIPSGSQLAPEGL